MRVVPAAGAGAGRGAGVGAAVEGAHDLGAPSTVVVMHGAGNGNKGRLVELMSDCAGRGFPACALDFSGHGDSSGTLGELSLERRFVQARAVVDAGVPADHRLIMVGFSMSGHTVADLAAHYGDRVRAIGLCAPAVYAAEAWSVPFAAGFTGIIRAPGSWRRSPALDAFRGVAARAVLATPVVDEVIPEAVTEAIAAALGASAARFTRLVFPRAGHKLGLWFRANAAARAEFLDAVLAGSPRDPDGEPGVGADHLVH
ncbi:alpha/beta hydrolase [Embleya hyalina]|uniref:alpha/beta hydrolase n=1 Tax=Embleya hyalina TaxID=516124 RepID=UPI003530C357